jgi:Stress responsive A/B Barrel Domain
MGGRMFVHVVLWTLQDHADGRSRSENAALIKDRFEELANMLDGLVRMEVGIDVLHTDASADVALYAQFESRTAYEAYYAHPAHQALASFIQQVRRDRRVIDYEL